MELERNSLRRPRARAWSFGRLRTLFFDLSLCPLLQHPEKTADIVHRLPGILFGDPPADPALEYRGGLFNKFWAVLRHLQTKKDPAEAGPIEPPQGLLPPFGEIKNASYRASMLVLLNNWPHKRRGISTNLVESKFIAWLTSEYLFLGCRRGIHRDLLNWKNVDTRKVHFFLLSSSFD